VIATLSVSGLSSSDLAIVGNAVAITVESRFCMNIAQATISGTRIWRVALARMGFSEPETAAGTLARDSRGTAD